MRGPGPPIGPNGRGLTRLNRQPAALIKLTRPGWGVSAVTQTMEGAAVEPRGTAAGAAHAAGSVMVLRDAAAVRGWLKAQQSLQRDRFSSVERLPVEEAAALFATDPEAALLVDRAARLDLPLLLCDPIEVSTEAREALAPAVARRIGAIPVEVEDGWLAVAVSDAETVAILEFMLARRIAPILARPSLILQAISQQFDRSDDEVLIRRLGLEHLLGQSTEVAQREAERLSSEQPVVKLVGDLIDSAIRRRASDIHIRPGALTFELLYRIDGDLVPVRRYLRALLPAVVSRIKVIGGMNLAEHRVPQDGRASASVAGSDVDLRISVIPTIHGEAVVIRILNTAFGLRSVAEIGFGPRDEQLFRDVLMRSQGMLLVTGPTGSGKSTTLYAALLECRKQNVNIITVEDPVEAKMDDVLQVQINRAAGLTFARTLRNILRHDPDVVMIGEIRDQETAEIAVESALTGHLVFSTLHTNNAASTVTRLLDLGVLPFLLKSTLLAVLAQRLGRRTCKHCKVPELVDPHVREVLGVGPDEEFWVGSGCAKCEGRGVKGRVGIYELLEITPAVRALIAPGADAVAIHELAVREGMISITANAIALARAGVIPLQEAFMVRVD
jgi:type IV pilus assembly protein PilB